jgi:hypothetical protein
VRQRRLGGKRGPDHLELGGEPLELGDPLGGLCLLLVDQPADPLVRGAAVRADPDRDQGSDLLAAERGYCLRGRVTMRYSDGDTEFVEFTRADQTPGINTLEL